MKEDKKKALARVREWVRQNPERAIAYLKKTETKKPPHFVAALEEMA